MKIWFDKNQTNYNNFIQENFLLSPFFNYEIVSKNKDFISSEKWVKEISSLITYVDINDADILIYHDKLNIGIQEYVTKNKKTITFFNDDKSASSNLPECVDVYRTSIIGSKRKANEFSLPAWSRGDGGVGAVRHVVPQRHSPRRAHHDDHDRHVDHRADVGHPRLRQDHRRVQRPLRRDARGQDAVRPDGDLSRAVGWTRLLDRRVPRVLQGGQGSQAREDHHALQAEPDRGVQSRPDQVAEPVPERERHGQADPQADDDSRSDTDPLDDQALSRAARGTVSPRCQVVPRNLPGSCAALGP